MLLKPTVKTRTVVTAAVDLDLHDYAVIGLQPTSIVTDISNILVQQFSVDILQLRYIVIQAKRTTGIEYLVDEDTYLLNFVIGKSVLAKEASGVSEDYREGHYQLLHMRPGGYTVFYPPGLYRFLQLEIKPAFIDDFITDKQLFYDEYGDMADISIRRYNNLSLAIPVELWVLAEKVLTNKLPGFKGTVILESAAKELLVKGITQLQEYQETTIPIRKTEVERLERIKAYILKNLDQKITVADICKEFNIGKTWLYQGFTQLFHDNVQEYIHKQKIDHAMELLKTDLPINEVAFKVGFVDPDNFSRAFKQRVGITPTAFRKQHS